VRGNNEAAYFFRDFRDDGVAKALKAVHPIGNPISHSTHSGFNRPPGSEPGVQWITAAGSAESPLLPRWLGPPFAPSDARGLGQSRATRTCSKSLPGSRESS
jgi:hypothetical protein